MSRDGSDSSRKAALGAILLCAVFYLLYFSILSLDSDPLHYGSMHPDERAIIGAAQFRSIGYADLAFTQNTDSRAEFGIEGGAYARHPSGGVVFLAWLQDVGLNLAQARFLPLLASTIGLFGFFLFFRRVSGSGSAGLAGMLLLMTAAPYFWLADSYQLYSYALMVKGLSFWLLADCALRSGRARLRPLLLSSLLVFICVTVFGLETMPSVGLMSFFAPLLLVGGGLLPRVGVAVLSAGMTGLAMALAWVVRVWNIMLARHTDLEGALADLRNSMEIRTVGAIEAGSHGRHYVAEVVYRLADYMPIHIGLAIAALAAALWFLRDRGRPMPVATRGAFMAAALCLLSEGPYFAFMRQHVYNHVHTSVHISTTAAAFAALFWAVFGAWRGRTLIAGTAIAAAAIAAVLYTPLRPYGNVLPRHSAGLIGEVVAETDGLIAALPADSAVFVMTPKYRWYAAHALARRGLSFVVDEPWGKDELPPLLEAAGSRPLFILADDLGRATFEATGMTADFLGGGPHLSLLGLRNFPDDLRPKSFMIDQASIRKAELIAPTPSEIETTGIRYALINEVANGLWLHAPPPSIAGGSVGRFAIDSHGEVATLKSEIVYEERVGQKQPRLVVDLVALRGGEEIGRASRELTVGAEKNPLALTLAKAGVIDEVRVRVSLAAGETHNTSARIVAGDFELAR